MTAGAMLAAAEADGYVVMRPEPSRLAQALLDDAADRATSDAEVYSLVARRTRGACLDLEAELAALADEAAEWAASSFEAGAEHWPTE